MIANERDVRQKQAWDIAQKMMVAARTAPKGKGVDIVECLVADGEDVRRVSQEMLVVAEESGMKFFVRDAQNLLGAQCVVFVGTREQAQGLNCGHCGFATCGEHPDGVPCAINSVDVGIALGAACSKACDYRVDTRVMFSAGLAAQRLDLLPGCKQVYGIPVSIASKSPFFDRK